MPSFYGSISVSCTVDTSIIDAMAANAPEKMDALLAKTCGQIETDVKSNIIDKHVIDTGNLLGSIHFEKIEALYYRVADGTDYGVFQELGTRYIIARPFFIPGVEKNADVLASGLPGVLK